VIVDYAMPGMTGASVTSSILERRPEIPILLVTGFPDEQKLAQWPAERILYKPFSPDQLLDRVAELLQRNGNGAEARQ